MLLMVLPTGDEVADMKELVLARDEAELEDLRKDVRML